ncbi:MAG: LysR substrate-binding domain-containing protein, partial [Bacteroidota bacterium]
EFGRRIEQLALELLSQAERIEAAANKHRGILTGNIRIATVSTGKYVLPYFLEGFMRKNPGVNISVDVTNKALVVESLKENRIDFGLVSVFPEKLAVVGIPLLPNELYLTASTGFVDLPKRMTKKRLGTLPLIFREEGSATRSAMSTFLTRQQIPTKRAMVLVSTEAVKQAVKAGLGLSVLPRIGIRSELQLGNLQIIPMKGLPIVTEWNLTYLKGKMHNPASQALMEYISHNREQIVQRHFSIEEQGKSLKRLS